tara:strand:+ start:164 stop:373 length:210 start_codon:yes stop_codon:yes gene_type:complete
VLTIKRLISELQDYPKDTRIDFILLNKDWEDSTKDTYLDVKGIVGSGEAEDGRDYVELGVMLFKEENNG